MSDAIKIWAWLWAPWAAMAAVTAWWDWRLAALVGVVTAVGVAWVMGMCRSGRGN